MPAYDAFHGAVKRGLIKDGWTITHDPYPLEYGGADLYVDLGRRESWLRSEETGGSLSRSRALSVRRSSRITTRPWDNS